jgi:hypothetical protein
MTFWASSQQYILSTDSDSIHFRIAYVLVYRPVVNLLSAMSYMIKVISVVDEMLYHTPV